MTTTTCSIFQATRARASKAQREPERLLIMRSKWENWHTTMPGITQDAKVHLGSLSKNMLQR